MKIKVKCSRIARSAEDIRAAVGEPKRREEREIVSLDFGDEDNSKSSAYISIESSIPKEHGRFEIGQEYMVEISPAPKE